MIQESQAREHGGWGCFDELFFPLSFKLGGPDEVSRHDEILICNFEGRRACSVATKSCLMRAAAIIAMVDPEGVGRIDIRPEQSNCTWGQFSWP